MELPYKLGTAFCTVLRWLLAETAYANLAIHRGMEAAERELPQVTFYVSGYTPGPDTVGDQGECEVAMMIKSPSDNPEQLGEDPLITHANLVAAVSVIWRDNLAALLNQAATQGNLDMTVEDEITCLPGTERTDGRCFLTERRWSLFAYNCKLAD